MAQSEEEQCNVSLSFTSLFYTSCIKDGGKSWRACAPASSTDETFLLRLQEQSHHACDPIDLADHVFNDPRLKLKQSKVFH